MPIVRRYPLLTFFALAYALSWTYWIPLALSGARVAPGSSVTHFPGLLGPAISAFIVTAVIDGRSGVVALSRRLILIPTPAWRFIAYSLSPLVFLALAVVLGAISHATLPNTTDFTIYSAYQRSDCRLSRCWFSCSTASAKRSAGAASRSIGCSVASEV